MEYWKDKVALIPNFDTELGISIAEKLSVINMKVIAFSNYIEKYNENKIDNLLLYHCDFNDKRSLKNAFDNVIKKHNGIDLLINNITCEDNVLMCDEKLEPTKFLLKANIFNLVINVRTFISDILKRNVRGHIINVNNITNKENTVYLATVKAVRGINETLRHEIRHVQGNIKVTNMEIDFDSSLNIKGDPLVIIDKLSNIILSILGTPEHLHIHEMFLEVTG